MGRVVRAGGAGLLSALAALRRLRAGAVQVAGVAWAQHRGVAGVEVRVDGAPWHEAVLAAVPGPDTWRQWTWTWRATPGSHTLEVRATDVAGHTRQSSRATPFPVPGPQAAGPPPRQGP
ncbi:Ig-like domain-containing protein [Streptosporangium canum]|uniref:Ig-like domain-containing protein n=1 Tax=Streptosporangium canum TaxID=324952 RepID=UPI00341A43B0